MRFAICSAAYPEDPAFMTDFFAGIEAAARGHPDCELVLAVEHGFDAVEALAQDRAGRLRIRMDRAPRPTTPAGLRRRMLAAALASDADIVVFADFDDRLEPEALGLHAQALAQADVSYGDMILIDGAGRRLGRRFFDGAAIPDSFVGPDAIVERNFLGFGNTAVRRASLARADLAVPDDAMPADWWFFTALLSDGLRACRAAGPVSMYRWHARSTLGGAPAATSAALRTRAGLALSHYAQLVDRVDAASAQRAVERLIRFIDSGDGSFAALAPALDGCPAVWFEDVARASRAVTEMPADVH